MAHDDDYCFVEGCAEYWNYLVPDPDMDYTTDIPLCRTHYIERGNNT